MTIPDYDGCPWPVDPACLGESWEADFEEPVKTRAIALASNTLRRLTGYRVGGCPVTIRPCGVYSWADYQRWPNYGGWLPVNWSGTWHNTPCGPDCRHSPKRIRLTAPNGGVEQIKVDGSVLVEGTDYWVDGLEVIRMGDQSWPTTQNLDLPDTEVGTFSITYYDSFVVDGAGAYACGILAREFALACSGKQCRLPATITSIVRQGASFTIPSGSFPGGLTGIREVDAYVSTWNPNHRSTPLRVWAP